ncbi:MAG TPA: M28 family peptidase [Gemmatimonadaceae bacterium]
MKAHLVRLALAAAVAVPTAASAQQAPAVPPAESGGVVPLPETTLPRTHTPVPTTPAITAGDLMTRLYIFADDSMQGREAGTAGNVKGTDYIASEIKKMGLEPAGDSGTYFQTIPLVTRALDGEPTFAVGGTALTPFADFLPLGPASVKDSAMQVVYGGDWGDSAHALSEEQAKGKLVVYSVPQGLSALRSARRGKYADSTAAAVALIVLDSLPKQYIPYFQRPVTFVNDPAMESRHAAFLISNAAAAKLFTTPVAQLAPGATGAVASVNATYTLTPVPFPARNVVGIVRGSDPKLRGEYVAIGAHNDHIGIGRMAVDHDSIRVWNHVVRPEGADDGDKEATPEQQSEVDSLLAAYRAKHPGTARPDSINNGADDDGSGSVSVLEIAQHISSMKKKPKRSILFVWHVGEEKGLLGSAWFTDHPTVPRDSIVAQLNMDMIGRGDAYDETGRTKEGAPIHGGPGYVQLVGSRRLSTELGDIIERVNKEGKHDLVLDYSIDANGHPANIYCRSDHYEYARYGIPITFFTTGLHSDYHQVTDEPEYIDYEHMARVVNLVDDVAQHVANLDHRVVVDHPKPDPKGACQQ